MHISFGLSVNGTEISVVFKLFGFWILYPHIPCDLDIFYVFVYDSSYWLYFINLYLTILYSDLFVHKKNYRFMVGEKLFHFEFFDVFSSIYRLNQKHEWIIVG